MDSYDPSRLVPLLGRHDTFGREQWIFFDLQFTCHGMLTKWIFRGLPDQDIGVELTTWWLNTQSNFFTSYDQVSTTERNAARPTRNGAVFTYELFSPVDILPGDIVGVEMGFISFGGTSNNVIALNTSGNGSTSLSYRRSGGGPSFILQSPTNIQERGIIPLLQAVIGELTIKIMKHVLVVHFPDSSTLCSSTSALFAHSFFFYYTYCVRLRIHVIHFQNHYKWPQQRWIFRQIWLRPLVQAPHF